MFIDISNNNYERIFIVGELAGSYDILIRLLYEQNFNYKDCVVFTGNFIDLDNANSIQCLEFLRSTDNAFVLMGTNENDIKLKFNKDDDNLYDILKSTFSGYPIENLRQFVSNLPLYAKVYPKYFAMHAGVSPAFNINEQKYEEIYFSIDKYDSESRFYQYLNPDELSWYENVFRLDGEKINIIFSKIYLPEFKVKAGFNIGRTADTIRCLLIDKFLDEPIIIEAN